MVIGSMNVKRPAVGSPRVLKGGLMVIDTLVMTNSRGANILSHRKETERDSVWSSTVFNRSAIRGSDSCVPDGGAGN